MQPAYKSKDEMHILFSHIEITRWTLLQHSLYAKSKERPPFNALPLPLPLPQRWASLLTPQDAVAVSVRSLVGALGRCRLLRRRFRTGSRSSHSRTGE